MPELGLKDQKKRLVKDKEEFIDPSFFKIQFSIKGRVFKKAVDGLLAFETDELDDLIDEDLDKALDQCSYYRFNSVMSPITTVLSKSNTPKIYINVIINYNNITNIYFIIIIQ